MKTSHRIIFNDARNLENIQNDSVDLVVTSPPYPMIEMWDVVFKHMNPKADWEDGYSGFIEMHKELKKVWKELYAKCKLGAFVCINIGDATRTVKGKFSLYPNGAKVIEDMIEIGFNLLPSVVWNKPTNSPNKFMGSGTLPAGAYVTLEYEHILIFRKGEKRSFPKDGVKLRQESSIFWEERNEWFSNIWKVKGSKQKIDDNKSARKRSGSYPLEIPYRLISMYSLKGDTVLDPFLGTGTTTKAAILLGRSSIGVEIDPTLKNVIWQQIGTDIDLYNEIIDKRIQKHLEFVNNSSSHFKYESNEHGFKVKSNQEKNIQIRRLTSIEVNDLSATISYSGNS